MVLWTVTILYEYSKPSKGLKFMSCWKGLVANRYLIQQQNIITLSQTLCSSCLWHINKYLGLILKNRAWFWSHSNLHNQVSSLKFKSRILTLTLFLMVLEASIKSVPGNCAMDNSLNIVICIQFLGTLARFRWGSFSKLSKLCV